MAIPDFEAYAKSVPKVSPLGAAIQSGIGTYGELEKMQLAKQQAQQQAQTSQLQQQRLQESIKEQPQAFASQQQTAALNQQIAAHQVAAGKMQNEHLGHLILQNNFADLASVPSDQKPQFYQNLRNNAINNLGIDPSQLPAKYNQQAQTLAQLAVQKSPAAAVNRKMQNDALMQELKNRGVIRAAQAKAGVPVTPGQAAFQKAEGTANSQYISTVNTQAQNAQNILQDATQLGATGQQIPNQFGYMTGNVMRLTTHGQESMALMKKLVLDLFSQMPHIGRGGNILLNTITGSKPSANMNYTAFKNLVNTYHAISSRAIEKNEMVSFLKSNGVIDRNKLENIWASYQRAAPFINRDGTINQGNLGKWSQFLRQNPALIKSRMGMHSGGEQSQTAPAQQQAAPQQAASQQAVQQQPMQTTAQQAAPTGNVLSSYYGANPYDNLSK